MRRALVLILLATLVFPLSTSAQLHEFDSGQIVVVTVPSNPMRLEPSTNSRVVITVVEGNFLRIIDGDSIQAEGLTWWHVQTIDDTDSGWLPDSVFAAAPGKADSNPSCWTEDQATDLDDIPQWTNPPARVINPDATYLATITTTEGKIVIQLDAEHAPIATNNFVCLAEAGFYDGTVFHRTSKDFLIQGGDPSGTGTGGPGYTVVSDPTTGEYPEGSIALANSEPDANGSQFFITATELTGKIPADYPVFGQVISGQPVVDVISKAKVEVNPRGELSQPVDPVVIESIEITVQEDEVGPPLPTPDASASSTPTPVPTITATPTTTVPAASQSIIELDAKDIAFVPTKITVNAVDEPVTIRMKNTGAALHNFSIDALGIDVDVSPGETVDVIIPAGTAPGTYDFYCNVPGHKEAGMVGTLVVKGTASTTSQAPSSSCAGLATYKLEYDQAYFDAFDANPAATAIIDTNADDEDWLFGLSSSEFFLLANMTSDIATNLDLVTPPAFAQEWHRLQVESIRLLAEMLSTSANVGFMTAAFALSGQMDRLEGQVRASLNEPNDCASFVTWAFDESFFPDDELGATSVGYLPGPIISR